ncbi:Uncharacterised protein [Mycobacteroides abscessus subsp. abscessus]|nr:Uncharacterised protein [Mycobacteroides abscessus subsp. abscessus]
MSGMKATRRSKSGRSGVHEWDERQKKLQNGEEVVFMSGMKATRRSKSGRSGVHEWDERQKKQQNEKKWCS